jgi:hypothetical protein
VNFLLRPFSDTKLTQTLDYSPGTQPGALILAFRSKAIGVVQGRYASTAKRYEAAGRTPPALTGTVPGSKFITFLGTAIILIGIVSLVLALTR